MRLSFLLLVAAAALAAPGARAEGMGLSSCETFFRNFEQCMTKVPAGRKPNAQATMDELKAMAQKAYATYRGDRTLTAAMCEIFREDTAKEPEFAGYGCTW